jgi:hypothetical protein
MKYLFLTEPDSNGVSEVFHSVILLENLASEAMVSRWNSMTTASTIIGRVLINKENVVATAIWDDATESLTLPEGIPADSVLPVKSLGFAFFVDNVLTAYIQGKENSVTAEKFTAALTAPVKVMKVEDTDPQDLGYTYDGTNFSAPVEN